MLSALIGAGSSLLGGLFNSNAQKKQMALQKEFAQKGIQWKAEDAEKAGISKLYALGANTTSYSPVSVGGGMGDALSTAGQNIGRAIDATQSPSGRVGHMAATLAETQVEGARLDNDIKRAHLASMVATRTQPGNPPAYMNPNDTTNLVPGQGNSEAFALENKLELARKIAPARPETPHLSSGVNPEVDMYRTARGFAPMIPEALGEALESQPVGAAQWMMRNHIMPSFNDDYRAFPRVRNPDGTYWVFNPWLGQYTKERTQMDWRALIERLKR